MIISVSRRTDIPNYYAQWFYNRIKEGYVLVRNPMNMHQVSKINLASDLIDCIVFWTKNPFPMLKRLNELDEYKYYFQFTLNAYGKDIEPNIPAESERIDIFQRLSDKIGPDRVIWRYDPILLNNDYTIDYHAMKFDCLGRQLQGYTKKCIISFMDFYRNTSNNVKELSLLSLTKSDKRKLAEKLSQIAFSYGLKMETCAEDIDLEDLNISHARCIDDRLIENITGYKLDVKKDKSQRLACGCIESADIGMYNTCLNGCKYCYANYNINTVRKNVQRHNPISPMLYGQLAYNDKVKARVMKSCRKIQPELFSIILLSLQLLNHFPLDI